MSTEVDWLLNEKYQGEKTADFFSDCVQLEAGKPLAYIIGHIPFLDCTIYLDSKPLIPRVETEFWVEQCIVSIKKNLILRNTETIHILDLCAGSGCIGVALAKALPVSKIDFVELDPSHLPTILQNCQKNDIATKRFTITSGNLFAGLPLTNRYNYIISNPPYIDPELDRTEASVKNFEPTIALYGGESGMALITEIIKKSPNLLKPNGELWLEHEPEQTLAIKALGEENFTVSTHEDQYGIERFSRLVLQ